MKIGIMGAMIEEVQHLREALFITRETTIGPRTFYEGTLWEHDVVLGFSRWGKVAAASTATTMIDRFAAELLIFTGVAGSATQDVRIGDVVIAERLIQHDMDASPTNLFERFEIPGTKQKYFEVSPHLVALAASSASSFLGEEPPESLASFSIGSPSIHRGTIASGDQFMASTEKLGELRIAIDSLKCVEMEGAAVAQVAYEHNVPLIVVRSISDNADHSAHLDFPRFVAEVASHYSHGIVKRILQGL